MRHDVFSTNCSTLAKRGGHLFNLVISAIHYSKKLSHYRVLFLPGLTEINMISDFVNLFYHQGRSELERRLSIVTSQRESKRDISDLLECPVCLETCQKETFVCRFGHLVCSGCKVQGNIKLCPVCRCPNLQKLSQFSEIVKKYENFSCTNGCGHLASDARKLAEHVEICLTK